MNHPVLCNLFPRENLIGGTKRQPNLSEILSPTVQPSAGDNHRGGPGSDDGMGGGGVGGGAVGGAVGGRWNGSYHCQLYKRKGKCDVCSHMVETSTVTSYYFNKRLQSMDAMSISRHHRRTNTDGLYICVRTQHVHFYMLEALQMCVGGGPRQRKLALTGMMPAQGCINTS